MRGHEGQAMARAPMEQDPVWPRIDQLEESGPLTPQQRLDAIAIFKTPEGREEFARQCFPIAERMLRNTIDKAGKTRYVVEDIDDVVTQVVDKAQEGLDDFEGRSAIISWLFKIAHNEAMQYFRKKQKLINTKTVSMGDLVEGIDLKSNEPTPEEFLINEQKKEQFKRSINSLPSPQREIMQMHYIEEMSLDQIAQKTGITLPNVKTRLFRTRRRLLKMQQDNDSHA